MPHIQIIKANIIAGLLSGVLAPIIWPLIVLLTEGKLPTWSSYPLAALSIFSFATILSLIGCIIIGIPTLLILENNKLNKPIIAGLSGLVAASVVFFIISISNNYPSLSQSWPLAAFFACIGGFCGFTASALTRRSRRTQQSCAA